MTVKITQKVTNRSRSLNHNSFSVWTTSGTPAGTCPYYSTLGEVIIHLPLIFFKSERGEELYLWCSISTSVYPSRGAMLCSLHSWTWEGVTKTIHLVSLHMTSVMASSSHGVCRVCIKSSSPSQWMKGKLHEWSVPQDEYNSL